MTDEELEKMGFEIHSWIVGPYEKGYKFKPGEILTDRRIKDLVIDYDRLIAGIEGAKYALTELKEDLKAFPETDSPEKKRLVDAIGNIEFFLGCK